MKKYVALVLILMMILPSAQAAEERDPIVGCWYMLYDFHDTPELVSAFGSDAEKVMTICDFSENGAIMMLDLTTKDNIGTPTYNGGGKWSNDGSTYTYSIIGLGSGDAYIDDYFLCLYIEDASKQLGRNVYLRLRRMESFNPYTDYIY